jgi:rhodanese-related sulfurtransferase
MKTARQLVDEAMAEVRTIDLEEARALHAAGQALFVDLRDVRELEREGTVPGAVHAPRGMLEFWVDPASPYFHPAFEGAAQGRRPLVLFCAAGWRSALAAKSLQEMGFRDVCHVDGGFQAWKAAGGPVAPRAPHPQAGRRPAS